MSLLSRLRLRTKLALLLGLSALALLVAAGLGAIVLHQRMIDDRSEKLQAIVQSTISVARSLESQVAAGKLTREQAISQMRDQVHAIRFDGGNGYVIGQGDDGLTLMHGISPALEGKPTPVDTASGRRIAALTAEALAGHDSALITYMFPRPGQTVPERKIVAVTRFAPWQMVFIAGAYTGDLDAAFHTSLLRLGGVGAGLLVAMLLAARTISRDIVASLAQVRETMQRFSGGDLSGQIPGIERRDEAGSMATSLHVFRQRLAEAGRITAEQEAQRQQAGADKQQVLPVMADTTGADTTGTDTTGTENNQRPDEEIQRTAAMTGTAENVPGPNMPGPNMPVPVRRAGLSAQGAARAAAAAMSSVGAVASAAEQLAASIQEIGQQVAQSTAIVRHAVTAGHETRSSIEALNAQVGRIGGVADMIAARTNLLALNAGIETAQTGNAGPGFAAAASEVEQFTTRTTRSTEDIGNRIVQVREATAVSVQAAQTTKRRITEINMIARSIAAAVRQQSSVSAETALRAGNSAGEITGRSGDLSADDVHANAEGLAEAVSELRRTVGRAVRSSANDSDRRRMSRQPVGLRCSLFADGAAPAAAQVVNLSAGGARLEEAPTLRVGGRGTLAIDGLILTLPFVVRGSDEDRLSLAFSLEPWQAERVAAFAERTTLRATAA